jgi:hypothetical protein
MATIRVRILHFFQVADFVLRISQTGNIARYLRFVGPPCQDQCARGGATRCGDAMTQARLVSACSRGLFFPDQKQLTIRLFISTFS